MENFLKCELEQWCLIDSWEGFVSQREEAFSVTSLLTPQVLMGCNGQGAGQKRSRWAISDDSRPIHMKEPSASY